MPDINLLPVSNTPNNSTTKVVSASKKIGVYASILLILALLTYVGIYGFFYINGTVTSSSIATLENQIKAQEQTEQKIILLRDRVSKAFTVLNTNTAKDEIMTFSDVTSHAPTGTRVIGSTILPSELTISLNAQESRQITEFVRSLTDSGKYAQIETVSMDFSPKDQYVAVFRLVLAQTQ